MAGKAGSAADERAVLILAEDENWVVRAEAVETLEVFNTERSLDSIRKHMLNDVNEVVRGHAVTAYRLRLGIGALEGLRSALASEKSVVTKTDLLLALASLGDENALSAAEDWVLTLVNRSDAESRRGTPCSWFIPDVAANLAEVYASDSGTVDAFRLMSIRMLQRLLDTDRLLRGPRIGVEMKLQKLKAQREGLRRAVSDLGFRAG